MFDIFKKKGMRSALDECQVYHKKIGLDQELSNKQLAIIHSSDLFKDIESKHKSRNLSHYGGLAAFCSQSVIGMLNSKKNGNSLSEEIIDLTQKIASISIAIGANIPELQLKKDDIPFIESACHAASEWLKANPLYEELTKLTK
jgi:hypothetical protein